MNPVECLSLRTRHFITILALASCAMPASGQTTQSTNASMSRPSRATDVFKARVDARWIDDSHFWYRNDLRDGAREFILVDAAGAKREVAFDHARLAAALSTATGESYTAERLPIEIVSLQDGALTIGLKGLAWRVDRSSYQLTEVPRPPTTAATSAEPSSQPTTRPRGGRRDDAAATPRLMSPDGKQRVELRQGNIFLHSTGGEARQLSTDGTDAVPYSRVFWSPDSSTLVAYRIERGDHKLVYRLESSPSGGGRAVLHQNEYLLPGDKLDSFEMSLFNVATGAQIKPNVERLDSNEWSSHPTPAIRWRPDGRRFLYEKHDRGHQRLRVIEVDATTGESRNVLDEQSKTFIWTAHVENLGMQLINYLPGDREILYASEQSGWRHLYLIDIETGTIKPVTSGEWVLRSVNRIDHDARQIWFSASGVYPGQDPYLIHLGRVNFDGTNLTWLTESNGSHAAGREGGTTSGYSPDGKYLVISHSRVDQPPVTELRRVDTGKLVVELERAEVGSDWIAPEVFVAKGRDDTTDIWGNIYRPKDFDPSKKYPIIEDIYAGPQSSFTPKTFSPQSRYESLTSLGFIVVKLDGMGTANRSKAFHDVCWQNLKDAGFPDRIKWIKAAAAKYPYMDAERVGIYGGSAGGQNAAGALLFHGDFYKVAVANCGCHDNRMDKSSWNEQWMGYPVGPHYSASSNIDNAEKLKGRLQLVLGELDNNVPVESTYRFVDALVKARKDFEFVLIPGAGHGARSPITQRKLQDFFVRHLQGIEPSNPN